MNIKKDLINRQKDNNSRLKQNQEILKIAKENPQQYLNTRAKSKPSVWAALYYQIKGKPFQWTSQDNLFYHRPYLEKPLNDKAQIKVYKKARQVGISEITLIEELFLIDTIDYISIMHLFPRTKLMKHFAQTRINPAIESCPKIKQLATELQNIEVKQFGNSFLYVKSGWATEMGESIATDMVSFDEYDRINPSAETSFSETLSSSRFGFKRYLSTPTIAEFGVSERFDISTQEYRVVRCKSCGFWQILEYPENIELINPDKIQMSESGKKIINEGAYGYVCRKCKKGLKPEDRVGEEWIAKHPERDIKGYFFSQMNVAHLTATNLMIKKENYKYEQLFYNYVLGLEYQGQNIGISEKDILGNFQIKGVKTDNDIWISIGIDWGDINWMWISAYNREFDKEICKAVYCYDAKEDPEEALKRMIVDIGKWKPHIIVADAGYGKDRIFNIRKYFRNVYAAFYVDYTAKVIEPKWNKNEESVLINRDMEIQENIDSIKRQDILFFGDNDKGLEFIRKHYLNTVKSIEEEDGRYRILYKNKGADHLVHCRNYAHVGLLRVRGIGGSFKFHFL